MGYYRFHSRSLVTLTIVILLGHAVSAAPASSPKSTAKAVSKTAAKSPSKSSSQPTTSIDWTPILKTMQNGCDLPDFESLPPALVATLTTESSDKPQKVMGDYKVLNLKNASAWGLPIKKIQYGAAGAGFSSATVYFTDDHFMKLRDKFYIQTASGKLRAIDKTVISDRNAFAGQYLANGVGYNDGRVGVNFSTKTHSITCSWAHLTS